MSEQQGGSGLPNGAGVPAVPTPPDGHAAIPAAGAPAQRHSDYLREDVLKDAREAFAETIALKVRQLRHFIPKEKQLTNTDITGSFIEELVRGFIRNWIGDQRLVHGTFFTERERTSKEKALQIDGIVHDWRRGPPIISEGEFEIVHPAFCAGVIEIKMTVASLQDFHRRLGTISGRYMHHLTASSVMGVVVASSDPQKDSVIPHEDGGAHDLFNYHLGGWCPIFILFQERDGEYLPHYPAIDALIRATRQLVATTNYL